MLKGLNDPNVMRSVTEAIIHSRMAHQTDGPDADCDECVRLARELMSVIGLDIDFLRQSIEEGIPVPEVIRPMINRLLRAEGEEGEDPWS